MLYDPKSSKAGEFIHDSTIMKAMKEGSKRAADPLAVRDILDKAGECKGLSHADAAVLLMLDDDETLDEMTALARDIKSKIYGKRIVIFAPLYLSDYCVNNCRYCGYKHENGGCRRKLSQQQIAEEVRILQKMGHKRLAIEAGEDPVNCPIEYILESISTIYETMEDNGSIRRVNVNIAATTVENYRRLKDAGIGTYILFQETYHKPSYEYFHKNGPKSNYAYHTEAMDRAMEAGIEDVGIAPLFGLYDGFYETIATLQHAEHLEARFGIGPHTISIPRIRPAKDALPALMPVDDKDFLRILSVLRLAVPYTGIILSTREEESFRTKLLQAGVSQISAGSCTGVGGYSQNWDQPPQFEISDERSTDEILSGLLASGYIPSFCTACYRQGRTGDRFMQLAKSGDICKVCQPNALITLEEYLQDYASDKTKELGRALIENELHIIPDDGIREKTIDILQEIQHGERDFRF